MCEAGIIVVTGEEWKKVDVRLPLLPAAEVVAADEFDVALLVTVFQVALSLGVTTLLPGTTEIVLVAVFLSETSKMFDVAAHFGLEVATKELVSVAADEAGCGCAFVVGVALPVIDEFLEPGSPSPSPIPIAHERMSPKNAIAAWSGMSDSLSSDSS